MVSISVARLAALVDAHEVIIVLRALVAAVVALAAERPANTAPVFFGLGHHAL